MRYAFEKWHGTGNDFIVLDDRDGVFPSDATDLITRLCDRHFGIGSDGLILIGAPRDAGTSFHMEFYNPDGSRSFCGNGSRCAFAFWSALNNGAAARFSAIDGIHEAQWEGDAVSVTLRPVSAVKQAVAGPVVDFVHTGSPHQIVWVEEVEAVDLPMDAPLRRHDTRIWSEGSNVNYVQGVNGMLRMRTYERGVEAETLSCGSGVAAAALAAMNRFGWTAPIKVRTRGGELQVHARMDEEGGFSDIRLIGPAARVFTGTFNR
ncbi:MAG: diaminopimelate epimerase [Flavobacteriales bacterium]|nr:diaminopimelate epimerase [Flavobacteriales bacterium]